MVKITNKKQLKYCYKIYEQIYYKNTMNILKISQNTGLSRNTVSKYLRRMYRENILRGPCLRINPAKSYLEYVYLMQFENSRTAFQGLKEFPHMVYCAHLFGDWNTLVITDTQFDLKRLVGFKKMVFQGARGVSYTPKVELASWRHCAYNVEEFLQNFQPGLTLNQRKVLPELPWGDTEWMLYSAFHDNVRKKITKTLQEIEVRYEEYREWKNGLDVYCTTHTGFYPQGYDSYAHHCFLVSTEYELQVRRLFSLFPTTSFFIEVGQSLLVIVSVPNPQVTHWLYSVINVMKAEEMITDCSHAQFLLHKNSRG